MTEQCCSTEMHITHTVYKGLFTYMCVWGNGVCIEYKGSWSKKQTVHITKPRLRTEFMFMLSEPSCISLVTFDVTLFLWQCTCLIFIATIKVAVGLIHIKLRGVLLETRWLLVDWCLGWRGAFFFFWRRWFFHLKCGDVYDTYMYGIVSMYCDIKRLRVMWHQHVYTLNYIYHKVTYIMYATYIIHLHMCVCWVAWFIM